MAYCVFTNCLSILGSGITPYTSLDSRSGTGLINNGQMMFVGSSDNSGPLGVVFQHICGNGVCRADITATRYGISGNDLSLNVDSSVPDTGGLYIKYRGSVGVGNGCPQGGLDIFVNGAGTTNSGTILNLRGGNNATSFGTNQIVFNYGGGAGSNSYAHAIKSRHQSGGPSTNALDFFIWTPSDAVGTVGTKNVMTLDGTGNVGMGTCTPAGKLHISHTSSEGACAIILQSTNSCGNGTIAWRSCAGTTQAQIGSNYNVGDPAGNLEFITSASTRLLVTSTGNVGIGTSSPIDKFEVVGALTTSGTAAASKPNSGYLDYYASQVRIGITGGNPSTPASFRIDQYSCDYSIQRTPFYINASGNIGIGCLTPSTKLHVAGGLKSSGTTELVWIGTCDATQPLVLTFKAIGGATSADRGMAIISTEAGLGSNFLDINETSTRTRFFCSGNVNIGSCAATSYRLNVNGAFYAAGSSKEYKTSICEYNTDSCMFMKLKPVTYDYKEEWKHLGKQLKSGTQIGLIAEDTAEVFPELAVLKEEENEQVVRNVDYEKLSVILLSEVQKLRREVDDLKHKQ